MDVVVTGLVADTAPFYKAMDVFCLPSYREGLPNVVLEAFASKVVVVATKITGLVDIIEDGETGLLVAPENATALSEALKKILTDPEFSENLSKRAYSYVKDNFDVKLVIAKQQEFIENQFSSLK